LISATWGIASCASGTRRMRSFARRLQKSVFVRHALPLALAAVSGFGQTATTLTLSTRARNVDFSNFPFTRPLTQGSSLPSTCQVGQLFFNSAAAVGANVVSCISPNTEQRSMEVATTFCLRQVQALSAESLCQACRDSLFRLGARSQGSTALHRIRRSKETIHA
jgi:hypothetical protein